MKKGILITVIVAACACALTVVCMADGKGIETMEMTEDGLGSVESSGKTEGKTLVVYFSVPETDGIDA